MELKNLSKDNTLTNLANSILKFYGCTTYHDTMSDIDELLKKSGKKKICLFLFDAFGKVILEKHRDSAKFMYDHRYKVIHSVFPTTTVAATTAITTGKYPIETGYVGWVQYFKRLDTFVEVFPSKTRDENIRKIEPSITSSILKTKYLVDDINKSAKKDVAIMRMSFDFNSQLGEWFSNKKWERQVNKDLSNYSFVYAYNTQPDHFMHIYGTDSPKVKKVIKQINGIVKRLTKKHKDTLFLAVSDHGMVDVNYLNIDEIEGFKETLDKDIICLEGRFATFFVKDQKKFLEVFHNTPLLKDNFILASKEEIIKNHILGYSTTQNNKSLDTLGDFFLISNSKYSLCDSFTSKVHMKAAHAGMTKDEIEIFLQVYNK